MARNLYLTDEQAEALIEILKEVDILCVMRY